MKLGIIGLAQSGKKTLFESLTRVAFASEKVHENHIGTVPVPDARIDRLSSMYNPRKTTCAQVAYFLPGTDLRKERAAQEATWTRVRDCDALIHVVRNFADSFSGPADPSADFRKVEEDLIFTDLVVAEKRIERMNQEKDRGRPVDLEELALLETCRNVLDQEKPLRTDPETSAHPKLRGFTFLSAKPVLVLFNNADDDDTIPDTGNGFAHVDTAVVRGMLEREITLMSEDDAAAFLDEYGIAEPAMHRVIRRSYALLGLISFFTVGEDEVKAWTIRKNTAAVDAAEAIHSDIKKGFIRAEVVAYGDLISAGSYAEARKKGTVRLEGKTYLVQDGDIIDFRFNV